MAGPRKKKRELPQWPDRTMIHISFHIDAQSNTGFMETNTVDGYGEAVHVCSFMTSQDIKDVFAVLAKVDHKKRGITRDELSVEPEGK